KEAIKTFYKIRSIDDLKKKPSTSELLDWIYVLLRADVSPDKISKEVPFINVLLKKETDFHYFVNNYLGKGSGLLRR
ncbi:MAG: hypothetical protein QXK91_05410, partial [Nitrososphaerales archaeon]